MARYLLSVHTGTDDRPQQMSEDEARRGHARVAGLEAEMRAVDALVMSARLEGSESAAVVRTTDGKVLTTDGPFLETKEAIGGFYIIEVPNRDAALDWAAKTSAAIDMPIEVRPFWEPPRGRA